MKPSLLAALLITSPAVLLYAENARNPAVGIPPMTNPSMPPATYYVSSSRGNDQADGRSPQTAWRTLSRVNTAAIEPGDTVLFQRDNLWRGQLRPKNGNASRAVTYGAYGSGAKPIIQGSVAKDDPEDWVKSDNSLWATRSSTTAPLDVDVGNIIFDHGRACGVKKWRLEDLHQNGDFWYDDTKHQVWLYSDSSPTTQFHSIELALRNHIILEDNARYVTYEDLHLRYGGAHGIGGTNTEHITARRCDICFIGGSLQKMRDGKPIRYGNGVEFWNRAQHNLVEQCRIWEIYDAALTDQGNGTDSEQVDITYRDNTIWNAEYSFEFWNRPATARTENILFEHNTCVNAGHGWGHNQRPDPNGHHLMFWSNTAPARDVVIRNNIFCDSTDACMRIDNDWTAALTMDHNLWFQSTGPLFDFLRRKFAPDQAESYREATGFDTHSLVAEPKFHDAVRHDYRLDAGSPGLDTASDGRPCGAISSAPPND